MKTNSDNFRASAIQSIINLLQENDIDIVIYEPTLNKEKYNDIKIINSLQKFKSMVDVIIANRIDSNLEDVKDKVYTRDIYTRG